MEPYEILLLAQFYHQLAVGYENKGETKLAELARAVSATQLRLYECLALGRHYE